MKIKLASLLVLTVCLALLPALPLVSAEGGEDATVEGEILDLACYVPHADKGRGADHAACAKKCVKAGQPMGLITEDGTVYVLFADHKDSAPFEKAMDHAGETVKVTGSIAETAGMKGITVHGVESM